MTTDDASRTIIHCPRCAAADLTWHSRKNFECRSCGFTLYLNVAAAAAVIIECGGRILFGVRKYDPARGMLDLPGGFVDAGETGEEAALREVREELGIELPELRYLFSLPNSYPFRDVVYDTLDLIFHASFAVPPVIEPADDLADAHWVHRDEIDYDRIAFTSLREAVRRHLASR